MNECRASCPIPLHLLSLHGPKMEKLNSTKNEENLSVNGDRTASKWALPGEHYVKTSVFHRQEWAFKPNNKHHVSPCTFMSLHSYSTSVTFRIFIVTIFKL